MELDADSLIVLFASLNYSQRLEAIDKINQYIASGEYEKQRIVRESSQRNAVKKMDLGPAGSSPCPLCGK
jgi:hypothetical protein